MKLAAKGVTQPPFYPTENGDLSPLHPLSLRSYLRNGVAQRNGAILLIGEWVLHEACASIQQLAPQHTLSVNISAAELESEGLHERSWSEIPALYGVAPELRQPCRPAQIDGVQTAPLTTLLARSSPGSLSPTTATAGTPR